MDIAPWLTISLKICISVGLTITHIGRPLEKVLLSWWEKNTNLQNILKYKWITYIMQNDMFLANKVLTILQPSKVYLEQCFISFVMQSQSNSSFHIQNSIYAWGLQPFGFEGLILHNNAKFLAVNSRNTVLFLVLLYSVFCKFKTFKYGLFCSALALNSAVVPFLI